MLWQQLLSTLPSPTKKKAKSRPARARVPEFEWLEQRVVLSTFDPNGPPPPIPPMLVQQFSLSNLGDTGTACGGIVTLGYGGPPPEALQVFDYAGYHYEWNAGQASSGGWDFDYTGTGCAVCGNNGNTDKFNITGSASPNALLAVQNQPFSGTIVNFTAQPVNASDGSLTAGNLKATVFWGDGTSSTGTIQATGTGTFTVQGQHTWSEDGVFLPVVQIQGASPDNAGDTWQTAAAVPTFVLALTTPVPLTGIDATIQTEKSREIASSPSAGPPAEREDTCSITTPRRRLRAPATGAQLRERSARFRAAPSPMLLPSLPMMRRAA